MPITFSVIIVVFVVAFLQIQEMYFNSNEYLNTKAKNTATLIALTNSVNLWHFDYENVKKNVSSFFEDPEIKRIVIEQTDMGEVEKLERIITSRTYFNDNENFFINKISEFLAKYTSISNIEITEDILYNNNKLGTVELTITGKYREEEIKNNIIKYIVMIAAIISITIIIIIITSFIVTKPIILLKKGFDNLSKGDFETNINFKTKDEVGKLIEYFNDMVYKLKEKIATEKEFELEKQKRDITQKWANELEEKNTELSDSYKQLKKAQEQIILSEKMAVLGGLVAGVAHEINTPLGICVTSLSYFTDNIKNLKKEYETQNLTEEYLQEHINKSFEIADLLSMNVNRAAELIKSFKQVSVDQTAENMRIIDFEEYIHEIITSLHPKIKKKKIDITVNIPEKIMVNTYPGTFSQIFSNFIINSILHGFENSETGKITFFSVVKNSDTLYIEYSDDGKGLNEEGKSKIFEPFYTNKRNTGGTGLGAYILYNLITQRLKGQIKCESRLFEGVKFIINIPLRQEKGIYETL